MAELRPEQIAVLKDGLSQTDFFEALTCLLDNEIAETQMYWGTMKVKELGDYALQHGKCAGLTVLKAKLTELRNEANIEMGKPRQ